MKVHVKAIIFVLVILAVGVIFAVPYFNSGPGPVGKFAVTPNPAEKIKLAGEKGRPVFLEFYSAQ